MKVVVVRKEPSDGGMLDVTLALGATTFTVRVPAILDASEDAEPLYQIMANSVARDADSLRSIVAANRGV